MTRPTESAAGSAALNTPGFLWLAALLCSAALGLWARFFALGASALAVDEHYLMASVHNILAHGLPQFECGGYYTRGLLHQYASAGLLVAGLAPEVAIRLPAAVAGVIAVAGAGLLARHLGGNRLAIFVMILLFLSVWQVEFARFGRMYAPFQAVTVFYALAALKFFESGSPRHLWWLIGLGALGILVHEGGALLAAFMVLAMLLRPAPVSPAQIGVAALALLTAGAAALIDFRYLGAQPPYAQDLAVDLTGLKSGFILDLPALPPVSSLPAGVPVIAGAAVAAVLGWRFHPMGSAMRTRRALLAGSMWAAVALAMAAGLFLLAAVMLAAGALFAVVDARAILERRSFLTLAVCVGLLGGLWVLYALLAPGDGALVEIARRTLRYPDYYLKVWEPWRHVLPHLGAAIVAASLGAGLVVLFAGRTVKDQRYRLMLGVTLALLTAAVLSPQPYFQTRYTFFLYPLFLILLAQGAIILAGRVSSRLSGNASFAGAGVALLAVAALFAGSNDFRLAHLLHINNADYLYRKAYGTRMATHLYPRWDYRGVAAVLNSRAGTGDLVITTAYPGMTYYSSLFDAVYVDRSDPRLRIVSACGGARDLWSNLPLVYEPARLNAMVSGAARRPVWLVLRTERYATRRPVEAQLQARFGTHEVYRSVDGNLALLRIP